MNDRQPTTAEIRERHEHRATLDSVPDYHQASADCGILLDRLEATEDSQREWGRMWSDILSIEAKLEAAEATIKAMTRNYRNASDLADSNALLVAERDDEINTLESIIKGNNDG